MQKDLIKQLYELAGEIGALAETDDRYIQVYKKLADALDAAELVGLLYSDDNSEGI